ncbi:MAG: LPP20 family lipoprotein [Candidatus Latescibacteria bacterium]|nr:LPP20 family lipoprotein [Candidatus Latescibacterota bacterium]
MTLQSAPVRVSLIFSTLLFWGCGGPKTTNLAPTPTEKVIAGIPDWYKNPPSDAEHLIAVATATSRDMQMATQKAKTTAQADLAQQLSTKLGNLTKQFQEETGEQEGSELLTQFTSATKAVASETLVGSKVDQQQILPEKDIYRVYVLMSLPIGKANQMLMEKLKADQALYTRFRSTQAFEELDKEIKETEGKGGK